MIGAKERLNWHKGKRNLQGRQSKSPNALPMGRQLRPKWRPCFLMPTKMTPVPTPLVQMPLGPQEHRLIEQGGSPITVALFHIFRGPSFGLLRLQTTTESKLLSVTFYVTFSATHSGPT